MVLRGTLVAALSFAQAEQFFWALSRTVTKFSIFSSQPVKLSIGLIFCRVVSFANWQKLPNL